MYPNGCSEEPTRLPTVQLEPVLVI